MTGLPRIIDVATAAAGLCATAPLLVGAAIAVKLTSPGPAFFRQERMGQGGRPFRFLKLRTMRVQNDGPQVTSAGDSRITPVGRLLRKTKLDELPQLVHVLRGEMSLVGPRPEVPRYVDLDDPLWRRVLEARPGITDPVTLRLRNEEELLAAVDGDRERFYRDELLMWKLKGYAEYLDGRTWSSDVAVIAKTALAVMIPSVTQPPTLDEVRGEARSR